MGGVQLRSDKEFKVLMIISQVSWLNFIHNGQLKYMTLNIVHCHTVTLLHDTADDVEATRCHFCLSFLLCAEDPESKHHLTRMFSYKTQEKISVFAKIKTCVSVS